MIFLLDNKVVVTSGMQDWVLDALHIGQIDETKLTAASSIFW